MATNKDSFRNYLQLEKKYSVHTITAYYNDITSFESFNTMHFDQRNIDQANYNQIRTWIVSLINAGLSNTSVNRKIASFSEIF